MLKAWNSRSGKALPYLRRVAYLSSNGYQIIDTGIKANHRIGIAVDGKYDLIYSSGNGWFGGSRYSSSNKNLSLTFDPGGEYYVGKWNGYEQGRGDFNETGFNEIIFDSSGFFSVNGTTYSDRGVYTEDTSDLNVWLFNLNFSGYGARRFCGSIRSAKIFDSISEEVFRNYVTVLDLSGRPAMYDEVSGQFFYNQGTGEFTWGELDAA